MDSGHANTKFHFILYKGIYTQSDTDMSQLPHIGVDLVRTARIARLHAKFGASFLQRAFHAREAATASSMPEPHAATFLASRWAAKEALHKAIRTKRLLFPEIEIQSGPRGAPEFFLHGAAHEWAVAQGLQTRLTLSHEGEYAVAFVIAARANDDA